MTLYSLRLQHKHMVVFELSLRSLDQTVFMDTMLKADIGNEIAYTLIDSVKIHESFQRDAETFLLWQARLLLEAAIDVVLINHDDKVTVVCE